MGPCTYLTRSAVEGRARGRGAAGRWRRASHARAAGEEAELSGFKLVAMRQADLAPFRARHLAQLAVRQQHDLGLLQGAARRRRWNARVWAAGASARHSGGLGCALPRELAARIADEALLGVTRAASPGGSSATASWSSARAAAARSLWASAFASRNPKKSAGAERVPLPGVLRALRPPPAVGRG